MEGTTIQMYFNLGIVHGKYEDLLAVLVAEISATCGLPEQEILLSVSSLHQDV